MVDKIEQYKQKDGTDVLKVFIKPTKAFPQGDFFYCDADAIDLVKSYSWCLHKRGKQGKNICVSAYTYGQVTLLFHQEYTYKILGYNPDYLDHINGIEFDNRDINLNVVTQQQNARNKPTKGYDFITKESKFRFQYNSLNKLCYGGRADTEPEICLLVSNFLKEVYSDYNYDFLEDRRDYIHLLDQECRGIISHEEANYLRAKQLIENNPWYVYRYDLFDYCKENKIVIPNFSLDSEGFMVSPVTGKRLCPY